MIFETVKFSDITVNHDKKRIPLSTMERSKRQGSYRYYGAQGVIDYIDDYIFDGKYLLIAEDGENLKSKKQNIAQLAEGRFWVNNHAHIVQCNEQCRLEYLCFMLNSMDLSGYITGSAQPKLSQANMNNISFEIPSVEMQDLILSVILPIEKRIATNTAINENLEQQAQALFKAWFVDFEPFGGVMPEDWSECILDSMCSLIIKGITPKYNEHSAQLVINQKCVRNHQIDLSLARCHEPKKVNEKWLQYGDIVVNSTGTGTLGRAAQVLFTPNNMTVDSHVTIIRASKQEYIYYLGLWATSHEHDFEMLQTGSTGQTDLPRERLKQMQIVLPSDSILSSFSKVIKPIADIRIQKQQENQRLSALRDTLLPKLMNGEIDVSEVKI